MSKPNKRQQFFDGLSKPQKDRLRRNVCFWCEQRLDASLLYGCAAIGPKCSSQTSIGRATNCLNESRKLEIRVSPR